MGDLEKGSCHGAMGAKTLIGLSPGKRAGWGEGVGRSLKVRRKRGR